MRSVMKRSIASAFALSIAAVSLLGSALAANADPQEKVTYCHATHSAKNPYVLVTTAKVAVLRAHAKHQDLEDVIPAFDYTVQGETGTFPGQSGNGADPASFVDDQCKVGVPQ